MWGVTAPLAEALAAGQAARAIALDGIPDLEMLPDHRRTPADFDINSLLTQLTQEDFYQGVEATGSFM